MKFKMLGLALSLTAAFGLMACGDDSSSASDNKLPEKVKTLEEATKLDCNADLKCQMVFVEEENIKDYFFCDGKDMRPYSPVLDASVCPKGEDGDDDEIPNVEKCEVKKDGDKVLVKIVADGITQDMTLTIDADGVITEVGKFDAKISDADFKKACKEAEEDEDEDFLSSDCDESAKTITQTYKDADIKDVDALQATNELMCQAMLDPEGFLEDLENAAGEDGDAGDGEED